MDQVSVELATDPQNHVEPPENRWGEWGCAFGLGVLTGVVGLFIVVIIIVALLDENPRLEVVAETPNFADLDSTFYMNITATNPHSEPTTLHNIEISESFFRAFTMQSVEPEPLRAGYRNYRYEIEMPPRTTRTVSFRARARIPGRHVVEFDVCSSSQTEDCSVVIKTITVE